MTNPNSDALVALRDLRRAYVNALENGRDRIIFLGGDCDSLEQMLRGNQWLIAADKAIAALTAQREAAQSQVQPCCGDFENCDDMCIPRANHWKVIAKAAQSVPQQAQDYPAGAIENGRILADRLEQHYDFECQGGKLENCSEWQDFRRCFEWLATHFPQQSQEPDYWIMPNGECIKNDSDDAKGMWRIGGKPLYTAPAESPAAVMRRAAEVCGDRAEAWGHSDFQKHEISEARKREANELAEFFNAEAEGMERGEG